MLSAARPPAAPARFPFALAALLGAALLINYVDRGTISTAAPLIESEFHLAPFELGLLLSAFFFSYVLSQPLMGWLVDHVGAARVLAAGFTLWSVATFLAGLSAGIAGLVALRLVMGVGESVCYPSGFALISRSVGDEHRARATAIMQLGSVIGPALGAYLGGWVMIRYGWRAMFMALGLASLLWLLPWSGQLRGRPPVRFGDAGAAARPRLGDILRQRALWGTVLGNFCSNYAFYFVFTWVPLYLVHERGLSLASMKDVQSLIYVVDAASIAASGWLLDAWIRRGAAPSLAYKSALSLSAAGVGLCLLGLSGAGAAAGAVLLLATGLADGLNSPAVGALTQRFAGPLATGRWMGTQNAISNTAGILAPSVTGYLVQHDGGHYTLALWVTGGVALLGLLAWLALVPVVDPVDWSGEPAARPGNPGSPG
ncbi:MAG TPA: MFS transporter [Steroidobacteraceae bacterium]|nr:MFS transporter [Steroidobacteraceae bacterium]